MSGPGAPRAYLDHNATAPLRPEARAAVIAALDAVGNPSSVHHFGRAARRMVETARARVAALAGVDPARVVFTSGATEANALALGGLGRPKVLTSAIEHDSVLAWGTEPPIPVDASGIALIDGAAAGPGTIIAIMAANNETGVVQPVEAIAAKARAAGALVHCDAVQAAGRIPLAGLADRVDTLALSSHKIGGPQGVGALVLRAGLEPASPFRGGAQERRRRPGTENVAGIAGFGAAAEAALAELGTVMPRIRVLRDRLEAALAGLGGIVLGAGAARLPNTLCIAMPGTLAEVQLAALDLAGVAVSSGSACSSGKVRRSHVLAAMGVEDALAGAALRISLGPTTTETDVARCVEAWGTLARRRRAA
jgi:cysteine desulfurase